MKEFIELVKSLLNIKKVDKLYVCCACDSICFHYTDFNTNFSLKFRSEKIR